MSKLFQKFQSADGVFPAAIPTPTTPLSFVAPTKKVYGSKCTTTTSILDPPKKKVENVVAASHSRAPCVEATRRIQDSLSICTGDSSDEDADVVLLSPTTVAVKGNESKRSSPPLSLSLSAGKDNMDEEKPQLFDMAKSVLGKRGRTKALGSSEPGRKLDKARLANSRLATSKMPEPTGDGMVGQQAIRTFANGITLHGTVRLYDDESDEVYLVYDELSGGVLWREKVCNLRWV